MVGSDIHIIERPAVEKSDNKPLPLLQINSLSQRPRGPFSIALHDINLVVNAGEVLGIAGVAGNGQGELFDAISGEIRQEQSGKVTIRGIDASQIGISARRKLGAAFVPEERLGHGAVPDMALTQKFAVVAPFYR